MGREEGITPIPTTPHTRQVAGSSLPCFCPRGQLSHTSSARASSTVLPIQGARSVLLSALASKGQGQLTTLVTSGPVLLTDAGGEGQARVSPQHPCYHTAMNGWTTSPLLYPRSWFSLTPVTRTSSIVLPHRGAGPSKRQGQLSRGIHPTQGSAGCAQALDIHVII